MKTLGKPKMINSRKLYYFENVLLNPIISMCHPDYLMHLVELKKSNFFHFIEKTEIYYSIHCFKTHKYFHTF